MRHAALALLALACTDCTGLLKRARVRSSTSESAAAGSLTSGSVVISSDVDLTFAEVSSTPPLTPALGGVAATGSPLSSSGSGSGSGAGSTPADGGLAPLSSPASPVDSHQTANNLMTPFSIALSLTAATADATCSWSAPLSSLPCTPNSITAISTSDLSGANSLQASLTKASSSIHSNTLPIRRFVLRQFSNTAGTGANDFPVGLSVVGSKLYFLAMNSNAGTKLYVSDGTTLTQLSNIVGDQNTSDSLSNLSPINGMLYFKNSSNMFKTDGSSITTVTSNAFSIASSDSFTYWNGWIYYWAAPDWGNWIQTKLRATDGSSQLIQVGNTVNNSNWTDVMTGSRMTYFKSMIGMGSNLYFWSDNSSGKYKLFKWDGSSVTQVSNTSGSQNVEDCQEDWGNQVVYNNRLYFVAKNSSGAYKLFSTDGTTVTQVSNIAGDQSVIEVFAPSFKVFKNRLYFTGFSVSPYGATKVYSTDGTHVTLVADLDNPYEFAATPNYLYFIARHPSGGMKLYRTDGNTVEWISNTSGDASTNDSPSNITPVSDTSDEVYFFSADSGANQRVYRTDGGKIFQLTKTLANGNDAHSGIHPVIFDGRFYFTGQSSSGIYKLYRICDTSTGCSD